MNVLRWINQVDWRKIETAQWITLTYPDAIDRYNSATRKKDLYLFHRYLETFNGRHIPTLWACEWKRRQTGMRTGDLWPHLHMVATECADVPEDQVRRWWQTIIRYKNNNLQVKSKPITGPEGPAKYCSKYVSKFETLDIPAKGNKALKLGRHWGIKRKEEFPMYPVQEFPLVMPDQVPALKEFAAMRIPGFDTTRDQSFTLFGRDAAFMVSQFLQFAVDE